MGQISQVGRLSLRRELAGTLPLAVSVAVLKSNFCGFVGKKAMGMSDTLIAVLVASAMLGLLLTGPIIGALQNQKKMVLMSRILYLISLIILSIFVIPDRVYNLWWGKYLFLAQVFLAQIGVALVVTLRTSVWRANYSSRYRAKIVVIFSLCMTLVSATSIFVFTRAMDRWHLSFQVLYGISGLAGILAAYFFRRVRIRHEQSSLRHLKADNKHNNRNGFRFARVWQILATDRHFRHYMSWQMLNGFSTLLVEGAVLVVILNDVFKSSWSQGGSALVVIPILVSGITGLVWARVFDNVDIYKARFYGCFCWAVSRLMFMLAIWMGSLPLVMLSRAFTGLGMGIGQLSWRLGHMEFAPPEQDALYMGAHVSLTGIRGMIAPFLGIYLYHLHWLGPNGMWLIGLTAAGQLLAGFGFLHMRRNRQSGNNSN